MAKLQLPDLHLLAPDRTCFVPLPPRKQTTSKQLTAIAIRDGRRASQQLSALESRSTESAASGGPSIFASTSMKISTRRSSMSAVLEQDFTVLGKKSSLSCPFAVMSNATPALKNPENSQRASSIIDSERPLTPSGAKDPTPHQSADPICAALYSEIMSSPPPSVTGSAAKCPIRYLDQHSPEEVARYFETHKHEIPRSHEVCVRRYQRNEEDIRKLDAKYGNLVSMIQGLGQKHQPMLPTNGEDEAIEGDRTSNERVEKWAKAVSADRVDHLEELVPKQEEDARDSRFDRPLKDIRVGESPSRPWGISVPIFDLPLEQSQVSPPAPPTAVEAPKPDGKCGYRRESREEENRATVQDTPRSAGKCLFGQNEGAKEDIPTPSAQQPPVAQPQPTFIQTSEFTRIRGPQMVFTGPVFIGYPIEQAMAFIQQHRGT